MVLVAPFSRKGQGGQMSAAAIMQQVEGQKSNLREKGVAHVAILGSRAREDFSPQSDLDLLLDPTEGASFSLFDLVRVESILSDATGLPANVFLRRSLDKEFFDSIASDIKAVF
jgi:uncharacterized protein